MYVSAENTGVHGNTRPYISTKCTGVHIVTSMNKSKVKKFVRSRMNVYDKYGRYEPIQEICTDILGKVRKGIRYTDSLQHGS